MGQVRLAVRERKRFRLERNRIRRGSNATEKYTGCTSSGSRLGRLATPSFYRFHALLSDRFSAAAVLAFPPPPEAMTFSDKLRAAQAATRSRVCVGLDPDPARLPAPFRDRTPAEAVLAFNRAVIAATADVACAYKPNLAFYEALGVEGWRVFEQTVAAIPEGRLVIADAKRGDIGNTARMYAHAFFDRLGCDAVTVSPYMGTDAVIPFLETEGRCAFVLVATSNESAPELQALVADGEPVYLHTARLAADAAAEFPGEVGFVVGATRPGLLAEVRAAYPDVPFLVPGVGAQGGDAAAVAEVTGSGPLLVNSSRGILYASAGDDFADAARRAAEALRDVLGYPAR